MRDLQYMIDVMTAARDGKRIQGKMIWNGRKLAEEQTWFDMEGPLLNWQQYDYRIAPEPRKALEFSVLVSIDGKLVTGGFDTSSGSRWVTVREVLPE